VGGTAPRQDGFQQGGGNVLEDDRGEARSTAGMMDCKNGWRGPDLREMPVRPDPL